MKRFLLLALAIAGCGGGSLSIDDYGDAYHEAYCKYLTRCGAFASTDECLASNLGFRVQLSADELAAADAGKFDFDGSKAKSCVDKLANLTCDRTSEDVRAADSECADIVKGTVATGGTCADDVECVSQSCDIPSCSDACCQGSCIASAVADPVGEGAACEFDDDCQSGLYCNQDTTVCTTLKASGTACDGDDECAYGTACALTTSGTRLCAALPDTGGDCSVTEECESIGNACAGGVCVALALDGDACSETLPCSPFLVCDATSHCVARIATGGTCTESGDCAAYGAYCDTSEGDTGTCEVPQANGAPCTGEEQCDSSFCNEAGACADPVVCI